ncbi:hypothetical protein SETIT_1G281300v2 [Setaria italica]|uniref:mitogen-activated protein kinase kinase n=1 Tax=Setaria italica TaxID=4555 RepID=A0A368PQ23_SETIT|nr:hypothetical protein SETIT_1G281300v2 [Setaria italica]
MAMAKLRERRQLSLSVVPPALPPPFTYQEHPFGGMDTTPPGSSGPVIESVAELEKVGVLGHGADGTVYRARSSRSRRCACATAAAPRSARPTCTYAWPPRRPTTRTSSASTASSLGPPAVTSSCASSSSTSSTAPSATCSGGGPPPGSTPSRALRGACSATCATCTRLGIVHGDVKPSNLLVGRHGEVKIADFGATHHVSAAGRAHSEPAAMGTCAYMSPERLDPEGFGAGPPSAAADFSSDVFPLVAAGERPDWEALVVAVCFGGAPEVPVAATPEFRSFVRRCLEKDWRRRPTVEELLGHPFVSGSPAFCATKEWLTNFDEELTIVRKGFT